MGRKSKHQILFEVAKSAVDDVFSDKSVDRETTKATLKSIKDEIEMMLDSMKQVPSCH